MTFFLNQLEQPPKIKANNPDIDLSEGWTDTLSAAITTSQLSTDANFIGRRATLEAKAAKGWDLADRIGADAIQERARERGLPDWMIDTFTISMGRRPPAMLKEMQAIVFEMAEEAAADDPESWADVDFSDEAIFQEANEKLQAEYQDAQQILEMSPGGQTAAGFLGAMIGITADIKNLPFLLLGGGPGSIMRVIGREAAINMAAEAAFLPSQFEMAERLEIPDPNVAQQLAIAAAAGGVLGGAIEGGRRGLIYFKLRNRTAQIPGYDPFTSQAMVDEAEDILTSDTPRPFEQISRLQAETPAEPYRLENPINPTRPPLIPTEPDWDAAMERAQRGQVAEPGDTEPPTVTTTPLERVDGGPREPLTDENLIETMQAAIDDAKAVDSSGKRPLIKRLQRSGRGGSENLKIHPDGHVGQELKSRGINSRTAPGLFSRQGRKDLDNLVADEWEKEFPGIIDATGTKYGDNYLDRDGLIELLVRDAEGDSSWLRTRADVERLEAELENYQRQGDSSPADDFLAGEPSETGFFVDLSEYEFAHGNLARQRIAEDLDAYLDETGQTFLTDAEKAEILSELQTRGGDAEYLVERVAEREIELSTAPQPEDALDDIPFGDDAPAAPRDVGQGATGAGRSERDGGAEGPGGTRAEDPAQPRTEQTDAGEQIVAPGIEPVTQRQRLEAQQGAALRGGDAPADIGLFDTGARSQLDIFDDPASPEARTVQEAVSQDIRADIEANGPSEANLTLDDGRVLKTDQDVLDYLDEGDRASAFFDLCGKGPTG